MMIDLSSWDVNASDFPANGSDAEKLEFLVRYAVLAPSSHNSQPWLFDLHEIISTSLPIEAAHCRLSIPSIAK